MKTKPPCFHSSIDEFYQSITQDSSEFLEKMLSTGLYRFDQDHKRIATTMFKFVELLAKHHLKKPPAEVLYRIHKRFEAIYKQFTHHCEAEERLLAKHNYPKLDQRKHKHDETLDALEALEGQLLDADFTQEPSDIKQQILALLYDHVINNIQLREFYQAHNLTYMDCLEDDSSNGEAEAKS